MSEFLRDELVSRPRDSRHNSGGASLLHPTAHKRAAGAPGLAALLVACKFPICPLLAPGQPGAARRDLRHESRGLDKKLSLRNSGRRLITKGAKNTTITKDDLREILRELPPSPRLRRTAVASAEAGRDGSRVSPVCETASLESGLIRGKLEVGSQKEVGKTSRFRLQTSTAMFSFIRQFLARRFCSDVDVSVSAWPISVL